MINIYCIVNEQNEIIYVGQTKRTLEQRFVEHKKDINHLDKVEYLNDNICMIKLLKTTESYNGNEAEQDFIELYSPRFNRIRAFFDEVKETKKAMKNVKYILKNLNKKK